MDKHVLCVQWECFFDPNGVKQTNKQTLTHGAPSCPCCGFCWCRRLWMTGCTGRCSSADNQKTASMRRHWINKILSTSLTTNPVRQWQDCSLRRHLRLRWRRYDSAPSTDRVKAAPDAFVLQVNSSGWRCWLTQGWLSGTHRHCHGDGSCKAPDQCVVHGEPAEVWVPVAFRVQTHSQTCRHRQSVSRFNTRYLSFFILPELLLGRSLRISQRLFIESEGTKGHCLRIRKHSALIIHFWEVTL